MTAAVGLYVLVSASATGAVLLLYLLRLEFSHRPYSLTADRAYMARAAWRAVLAGVLAPWSYLAADALTDQGDDIFNVLVLCGLVLAFGGRLLVRHYRQRQARKVRYTDPRERSWLN